MGIVKKIRPYSVMVKLNDEVVGSGVLVKSKDNKCYLFTARHLFKKGDDTSYKKVKELHVRKNLQQTSINRESFEKEIFVDEILFFRDDLDLVVFSLKEEPPMEHLPIIKVLKNDHQTQYYHFYGYPNGAKSIENENTGHRESAQYIQSNEEENHVFRLSATKNIGGEAVAGYSGSGIFVENKERIEVGNEIIQTSIIYLVGILIRAKEELSYYEAIDLSRIIDDINRKANIEILTVEDVLDTKFTKNIKTKILKRNREDTFIQKFKALDNEENKKTLKEFLENSENELTEMTKKLADFYLLGGMAYKDDGDEESAKKYFRLATKFNPKYKRYEKEYQGKNEIDNLMDEENEEVRNYYHDGIIAFQYNKYDEAKKAFLEHNKSENIDSLEKIELHKYLSKIYLKEQNYIEAQTHAIEALDEYKEENSLEKAELCYEIFQICEKGEIECSSLGWIEKGLKYLGVKQDEKVLVIRRKLEIEKKKLKKDDYIKTMSPTLINLVQAYPEEYIEDFIKEYLSSRENESTNYMTIADKVEDLKNYLDGIKNQTKDNEEIKRVNPRYPLKD